MISFYSKFFIADESSKILLEAARIRYRKTSTHIHGGPAHFQLAIYG